MNSKKLNSSDVVEPVTIVSFCRTLLHEVLIFLLFFSISAVVFFVFFSALNSFAMMATNKPRPFKYCLWPKEWCSILNKQPKLHEPESLAMQQQHIERSRPKYDRFWLTEMELDKNKLASSTRLLFTVGGYLDTLLSRIFCFLVLSAIALLIIFTVVVAMDDIAKLRKRQNLRLENCSETKTRNGRCYWPSDWCRILYNCDWKEPMRRQSTSKQQQTQQLQPDVPPCSTAVHSKFEIIKFLVHQHPRKEVEQQPPVANEVLEVPFNLEQLDTS